MAPLLVGGVAVLVVLLLAVVEEEEAEPVTDEDGGYEEKIIRDNSSLTHGSLCHNNAANLASPNSRQQPIVLIETQT